MERSACSSVVRTSKSWTQMQLDFEVGEDPGLSVRTEAEAGVHLGRRRRIGVTPTVIDEHECRTDGPYEPCNLCGTPWEDIDVEV